MALSTALGLLSVRGACLLLDELLREFSFPTSTVLLFSVTLFLLFLELQR